MMDINYKIALSEVEEILKYTDKELVNKVPHHIKIFISENKDLEYKPNISLDIPIEDQVIKPETEAIISLLYRDYWCTEEEKKEFTENDRKELESIEYEKRKKYNIDNIFENKNYEPAKKQQTMVEVKEESFFIKILNKIKRILKNAR